MVVVIDAPVLVPLSAEEKEEQTEAEGREKVEEEEEAKGVRRQLLDVSLLSAAERYDR